MSTSQSQIAGRDRFPISPAEMAQGSVDSDSGERARNSDKVEDLQEAVTSFVVLSFLISLVSNHIQLFPHYPIDSRSNSCWLE